MTKERTYRVVTRDSKGGLRIKDYPSQDTLLRTHEQIGIDDCSTDLSLRGLPVFRGLIGPIPDKGAVRYESPEVFETLTKEWTNAKPKRRRRRSRAEIQNSATP
ncbi:MAG: hypothetical protein MPJ24_00660 [Pirellulaceae bacterium]|nr:hypothetical protein [Pirellulaceae bacterium]